MTRLAPQLLLLLLLLAAPAAAQPVPASAPATAPGATAPPGRTVVIERVAAVVNDSIILESEVVQRAAPLLGELDRITDPAERQRQWNALQRQVLGEMIDEELVLAAADEAKLEVGDEEVNRALDEVKRQNKLTDKQLEQALAGQGYTIPEYRKDVRRQILRLRAINVLVRPRVSITDDEVRASYDRLTGQSAAVSEVRVRQILIKPPERPTPEDMDAGRRRAGELTARARAGEPFEKLAAEASEDAKSRDKGGELGWFKHGELSPEWEEVLFRMAPGEVRGPVRDPEGLHVFQVVETRKDAVRPFDEAKEELRQQLYSDSLEKQTRLWLEELRKKSHVEIKL